MSEDTIYSVPQDSAEILPWIASTLSRIETKTDGLRTELLGNGQPGRIQRIEEDLSQVRTEFGGKYDSVNGRLWKLTGGLSVLGTIGIEFAKQGLKKIGVHF